MAEISPKVVCATYADRLAPLLSYILSPLLRLAYPVIWFVNLFVMALLKALRLSPKNMHEEVKLSPEELRTLVLESSHLMGRGVFDSRLPTQDSRLFQLP